LYIDGELTIDYNPEALTKTWSPSFHFEHRPYDCALVWVNGLSLNDVCPETIKEEWEFINKKIAAFLNSFKKGKVRLEEVCLYDLVPKKSLLQFYNLKNKITEHVFSTHKKPENHDFLVELILYLRKIESQNLNLNFKNLDMSNEKVRKIIMKIKNSPDRINYNPWGTVTGRLTTKKNSFPILTLNKELRSVIEPTNDCLLELDFNAAEIRVLLSLLGQKQPIGDLHGWISENIFDNKYNREQTKKKVFAWLYNPRAKNKKLNIFLNRNVLYYKYYKNGYVETPFGLKIYITKDKAVNYLIQSTASDLFLTSAIKVGKLLKNRKSNVYFCIHDSLVLDYAKEDQSIIDEITEEFSNTRFGFFNTNLNMGRNFGTMRKIK